MNPQLPQGTGLSQSRTTVDAMSGMSALIATLTTSGSTGFGAPL